jgi:hypothetical protein
MPMCVRISEPTLLPELMDSFLRNHCVAQRVDRDACVVVHVHATDAHEAWQEVGFFLRAWQALHPYVVIARTG